MSVDKRRTSAALYSCYQQQKKDGRRHANTIVLQSLPQRNQRIGIEESQSRRIQEIRCEGAVDSPDETSLDETA